MYERVEYWNRVRAQYGSVNVPAEEVYQRFDNLIRDRFSAFSHVKTGLYGRSVDTDIIHLLSLQAFKGRRYGVRWGVSLAFVPSDWSTKLRFHRTLRSARFDLFEDAIPLLLADSSPIKEEAQFYISAMNGSIYFQSQLNAMWQKSELTIANWFDTARDLRGLHTIAERQIQNKADGHYAIRAPRPEMVNAFILARLGSYEQALSKLYETAKETLETSESLLLLTSALEAANRTRSSS